MGECRICGYSLGGSHYHCGRCGKVGSYQGCYGSRDGGKTWGFSCKPEDVEAWEEKRVELSRSYSSDVIEFSIGIDATEVVDQLISELTDHQLVGVIEDLVDSMESSAVEETYEMLKAIHDRWAGLDNETL